MKKLAILFIFYLIPTIQIQAQNEKSTAPVKWQKYKISKHNLNLLLPKMPVLISNMDSCLQEIRHNYYVFAKNVLYGFKITNKLEIDQPDYCSEKGNFGKKNFTERIKEFKVSNIFNSYLKNSEEEKIKVSGKTGIIFKDKKFIYLFISDIEQDRWYEIWVANSNLSNEAVINYFDSITFDNNQTGIEIGKGANRMLGDEVQASFEENLIDDNETIGLSLFAKPMPRYTEMARKMNYQGSVTLKVIFLANGGIGKIEPEGSLKFGLTEQAIAAAKKIVFIPAKRKGKNINVLKKVQYTFSIY